MVKNKPPPLGINCYMGRFFIMVITKKYIVLDAGHGA